MIYIFALALSSCGSKFHFLNFYMRGAYFNKLTNKQTETLLHSVCYTVIGIALKYSENYRC